jgi:hypothetical protein
MLRLTSVGRSRFARFVQYGLISSFFWSAAASAQSDSAAARGLFSEARALMEEERFAEACPKLEESLRLDQGMGTQFNLAHCWEKLGRTASAWALFLDVAAAARAGNQPDRETAARERAKVLEAKLARLRIDVPEPSRDMQIERDGQDVGRAAWGTAMPVDPGKHTITVSAPGKKDWTSDVDVPATSRTVSVKIPALTDAPLPQPVMEVSEPSGGPAPVEAEVADTRRDSGGSNGQTVAAFIVGGVGLAAAATGTVFMIQSRQDNAAALKLCREPEVAPDGTLTGEEVCGTPDEQTRWQGLVDDAKSNRTIGLVGLGVGTAALATAVVLFVTADSGGSDSAFHVAPLLARDLQGAALSGTF